MRERGRGPDLAPPNHRTIVGVLLALALGAVGPFAVGLVAAPQAGAASCGPAPAGKIAVVVVIDRGSGTPAQHCVTISDGETGMHALRATGQEVRNEGAFICGIGGLPAAPECAMRDPAVHSWSYWHAAPGGSWTYSSVGAARRLKGRCLVEGWRYGPPSPKPPPRLSPPDVVCERAPAPAPPAAPPTTRAPVVPRGGGTAPDPGGSTARGGSSPSTPADRRDSDEPGAARPGEPQGERAPDRADGDGAGGGGAEPSAPGSDGAKGGAPSESAPPTDDGDDGDDIDPGPDTTDLGAEGQGSGSDSDEVGLGEQLAADGSDDGGIPWLGAATALVVIAALGGAAVVRSRKG